jgi:pyruvate kinase
LGGSDGLEEGSDGEKKILLDTSVCGVCQNCIQTCPHGIWERNEVGGTTINKDNVKDCTMDMECVRVCPTGAIEIISTR